MIRHLVALRFKPSVAQKARRELFKDLNGLKGHLDGILDYQVRENVSPEEPVVHGFRDLFWFDFRDEVVRDTYLTDAKHQAIGAHLVESIEGGVDGILVLDFEI